MATRLPATAPDLSDDDSCCKEVRKYRKGKYWKLLDIQHVQ